MLGRMVPGTYRDNIKARLREGKINIIVGTHALLENRVEFSRLGLAGMPLVYHLGIERSFSFFPKPKLKHE